MKNFTFLLLSLLWTSVSEGRNLLPENQKSPRVEKIINSNWTFNYFPDETAGKGYESPGFNDSRWPAVSLPHTWLSYETTGEFFPFNSFVAESDKLYWWIGWGWYRKHFSVSKVYDGSMFSLEFKRIQKYCKVWLNGKYLGDHKGGDSSFGFDISSLLKPGEDNILAIAVNNLPDDNFIMPLKAEGNYNICGGITGDVTLKIKNKLYIPEQHLVVTDSTAFIPAPEISERKGLIVVKVNVKNDNLQNKECILQTTIADRTGKVLQVIKSVAVVNSRQLYKFEQTAKPVKNLHPGSLLDQNIYKVYTEVIDGKDVADIYNYSSGLKFITGSDNNIPSESAPLKTGPEDVFNTIIYNSFSIPAQDINAGEAARILLTCSAQRIIADRGSIAILTADIVDSSGNHVSSLPKTIKWNVSGPAVLAGPEIFNSGKSKDVRIDEIWNGELPVSNVIRSTGKPGKIVVSVFATGLASGSFAIESEESKSDNSVITEAVLDDEGRKSVARLLLTVRRMDEIPHEIKLIDNDFIAGQSDIKGFSDSVTVYLLKNNPGADTVSFEFKALVDVLASNLLNNNGRLTAPDFNYAVDHYNICRLLSGYIKVTKLPSLFKETLKKYYAGSVIREGVEKNAGEEMNWLNWIPSGGIVVVSADKSSNGFPKGAKITSLTELSDIISLVHPGFAAFSDEAKERALIFITKMNPYIRQYTISESDVSGNLLTKVSYKAEKGEPVLIPLLKFIAE
jgi:hypothetical protein